LQRYGYRVLRFSNQQVLIDLPTVLTEIKNFVMELQPEGSLNSEPPRIGGQGGDLCHS
jgi:hypothetical protein